MMQNLDNDNNVVDSPRIYSLNDLQVLVSDEIKLYLAQAYEYLYSINNTQNANDTNSCSLANDEALKHINRVFDAMKSSPETTICRINSMTFSSNITNVTSKDIIKQELRSHLQEWMNSRSQKGSNEVHNFRIIIEDHPILQDVIRIQVTNESVDSFSVSSQRVPKETDLSGDKEHVQLFLDWPSRYKQGWPMTHRAILCDRFCGEAVLRGSDIFVRGIIAADSGINVNDIVAVYADCTDYNSKTTIITTTTLEPTTSKSSKIQLPSRGMMLKRFTGQCVYLGLGKSVCKRSDYFSQNSGVGIEMLPQCRSIHNNKYILPPISGVIPSSIFLQNEPSILVATLLQPFEPNQRILDMCSAPGGKALHLANLTRSISNVTIISCDKSRKKMIAAKEMFTRYGATNIVPLALDSTRCCVQEPGTCQSEANLTLDKLLSSAEKSMDGLLKITHFPPESFDRILLDPPCSALGLRPKLQILQTSQQQLESFAQYQRSFVREAIALLKRGGLLTYSTCTIHVMENECMVKHIIDEYSAQIELLPIETACGLPGLPGFGLTDEQCKFVRRFDPSDQKNDTIGFFIAKFRKKEIVK